MFAVLEKSARSLGGKNLVLVLVGRFVFWVSRFEELFRSRSRRSLLKGWVSSLHLYDEEGVLDLSHLAFPVYFSSSLSLFESFASKTKQRFLRARGRGDVMVASRFLSFTFEMG
jgi:hypothetical protein